MKKMMFFCGGGAIILVIFCAFIFLNGEKQDSAVIYHRYFKISLPQNFKNFKYKKYFTGRVYIEYELPIEDLGKILKSDLPGYTAWKPLAQGEYGTPERDYDNETNPGALACKKNTKKELTFIVVDIKKGRVFGFYGPQ
jgi:hypothetical protein